MRGIRMLVHIVSFGGAAVVGTKDIMAVSRAWGNSFAGLRRLHCLRSLSFSTSLPRPTFDPVVQQSSVPSRNLRFISHAAALEETPETHTKKSGRLSRAERYLIVENFVLRHKDSHEGKWPSLNAIVKETGGSRLIVKDIVEELEKNSKLTEGSEALSAQNNTLDSYTETQVGIGEEGHPALGIEEGNSQVDAREAEGTAASEVAQKLQDDLGSDWAEESLSTPSEADSLWRRLQSLPSDDRTPSWAHSNQDGWDDDSGEDSDGFPDDGVSEDEDDEGGVANEEEGIAKSVEHRVAAVGSHQTKAPIEKSTSESLLNYGLFIRFLPLSASEADLRAAFHDCGEIVRAQAMTPKGGGLKFTYGFVDFSTPEALSKALRKEKVNIKGSIIITEACSGPRRGDGRPSSGRRPLAEHTRKSETYRNLDSRPRPGSRFKRVDSSMASDNGSRTSPNNGLHFVVVEGLSYPMPINAVERILSAYGEISRSELAREDGGAYSAHVEFKTEEARDSALASGMVYLAGRWCRITTGEPILTTVVRLSNVGNASENLVLQRCGKFGRVDNIVQRKEGVVDVYYHPTERRNMRRILDRLGEMNADFKRWHANLAPKCSPEEIRNSPEIQEWAEVQKDRLLDNLTGAMKLMIIDLEDLRELVEADRSNLPNSGRPRNLPRPSSPKSQRF